MKINPPLALWIATASWFALGAASAATDPAGTDTRKDDGAATQAAAPLTLTASQALPKKVDRLIIIDREPGDKSAPAVEKDHAVQVHYSGWLYDSAKADGKGEKVDASRDQRLPIPLGFFLNSGRVIKGWDLGLVGMRPKGVRTLIIPPSLAYGDQARPKVPANSTLIFDIELLDIIGRADAGNVPVTAAAAPAATAAATPAPPPPATAPLTRLAPQDRLPLSPTTLTLIDQAVGDGATAETGNEVLVHYTGWLYDAALPGGKGKQFDSSRGRNQPFRFTLGAGRVIRGWELGVTGMKVKGKRTLIIPADYGYGVRGAGGVIPPNATLIFEVELVALPKA